VTGPALPPAGVSGTRPRYRIHFPARGALKLRSALIAFLVLLFLPAECAIAQARAKFVEPAFDFAESLQNASIEHEYRVRNIGVSALRIEKVALTPPLRVLRMPAQIAPGDEASVTVGMETPPISGRFTGRIVIYLNDPSLPQAELTFSGNVVSPVELSPTPVLFLVGYRGETASTAVDIISHISASLRLSEPEYSTDRFTARLEMLEEGKRYRLTISLNGLGPGGKHTDEILIRTSSAASPVLKIPANTYLRERVYTFPEGVDLGALPLVEVRAHPDLSSQSAQTLMVYQRSGTDFRIEASTDLPQLRLRAERGHKADRYQLTVSVNPQAQLAAGPVRGTIRIETNDPEFPHLSVPVSGELLGQ